MMALIPPPAYVIAANLLGATRRTAGFEQRHCCARGEISDRLLRRIGYPGIDLGEGGPSFWMSGDPQSPKVFLLRLDSRRVYAGRSAKIARTLGTRGARRTAPSGTTR